MKTAGLLPGQYRQARGGRDNEDDSIGCACASFALGKIPWEGCPGLPPSPSGKSKSYSLPKCDLIKVMQHRANYQLSWKTKLKNVESTQGKTEEETGRQTDAADGCEHHVPDRDFQK